MANPTQKPLVLVDGSSYLYRAFHALPALTTSSGQPTGAVRGVISMLKRLLKDYQPTHMAVVFDAKGKTFRDDLYPEYKANRPPMPDDLREQIEPLHKLVRALGLPMLVEAGVEADDVIGTLAEQAAAQGIPVVISTGDKDMAQLVNTYVTLVNTMDGKTLNHDGVIEKFGVPPELIVDLLTLVGDKVDNVPGVDKVGPKTAVKWLTNYGGLDALIESADDVGGKVGDNLRAALDRLPLSRELVTIKRDVRLHHAIADLALAAPDNERLVALFRQLEFVTWLRDLSAETLASGESNGAAQADANYVAVTSKSEFEWWLAKLKKADLIAFDTETTSLDYMLAEIVGVSFAVAAGEAAYVPVAHDYPAAPEQLNRDWVLEQLRPMLEDPSKAKVGHNLKYDQSVLANHGIALAGIRHDTMLASYVINSTASRHDLDTLCEKHLGHQNIHFEEVAGKGAKQLTFNQVELEKATPYASEDADMCLRLCQLFVPKLEEMQKVDKLYQRIEIPLVTVLSHLERNGVNVDAGLLKKQSAELAARMAEVEEQAHEAAGHPFNLGSPKQLQAILFDELSLPVVRKTPKGQPSTAEDVLQELALTYDLPQLVLEHRSLSKLKSTYTDKLPSQINQRTGRVHTSYHQAVASTGRLSSSDPNLQNIPIRTEEGRRIRQAFVAPAGKKILAVDYSQIELRIMAHLSADPGLIEAFAQGLDVHAATASEVFAEALGAVTQDQRRAAKAINFGLIYGMSAFGLAKQLNVGRNEAQSYIDLYFSRYPGVKAYMDATREKAREQGFVETVFGRRLYLPDITSRNGQRRQYAERTAINAPMQGTAADIIKRAMISIYEWQQAKAPPALMVMQVHDELVFEVDARAADAMAEKISALMEDNNVLTVKLVAEAGIGDNWDEAH